MTILKSLEKYFDHDNAKLLDFLRKHRKEANFNSEYEFKKTLNKTRDINTLDSKLKLTSNNRTYYSWILFFNIFADLPLSIFDISEHDPIGKKILEMTPFKSTSHTTKINAKFTDDGRVKDQLKNKYKGPLKEFIRDFKSDLLIYDYINRFINEFDFYSEIDTHKRKQASDYIIFHGAIYRFIEKRVFNDRVSDAGKKVGVKYVRALSLPITGDSINRVNIAKEKGEQAFIKALKTEIIRLAAVPLFNHIINCNIYDESLSAEVDPFDEETHSGIYMVHMPTRFNSYAIINKMDKFLSEYYQYTKDGEIRLDRLHIASGLTKAYTDTVKIYFDEINNLTKGTTHHLGVPKFTNDGVEEILNDLIQELEEKKKDQNTLSPKEEGMLFNHKKKLEHFNRMMNI